MKHLVVLPLIVAQEKESEFKNEKVAINTLTKAGYEYSPTVTYEFTDSTKYIVTNTSQKIFFVRYSLSNLSSEKIVLCKTLDEFTSRIKGTYIDPTAEIFFCDNVYPFMFKGTVINQEDDNYAIVSSIGLHFVKKDKVFTTQEKMQNKINEDVAEVMSKEKALASESGRTFEAYY